MQQHQTWLPYSASDAWLSQMLMCNINLYAACEKPPKRCRMFWTRAVDLMEISSRRVEKAPCTDLRSDPTLLQNSYRTTQANAYVNHAHQTQAQSVNSPNLIKLKQYRVKRIVSPSTPTCWRQAPSFCSRRNTISHGETQTQQTNKQRTKTKNKKKKNMMCSLCRSVLCQVMWHSSSCSLNELLTPVLRADVSTGKLDSRFPVNKPQVLQIKVCWNYSSC